MFGWNDFREDQKKKESENGGENVGGVGGLAFFIFWPTKTQYL